MQTFEVYFSNVEVSLKVYVDLEDELIESLAKGKIPHDQIRPEFYKDCRVTIKYVPKYDLS